LRTELGDLQALTGGWRLCGFVQVLLRVTNLSKVVLPRFQFGSILGTGPPCLKTEHAVHGRWQAPCTNISWGDWVCLSAGTERREAPCPFKPMFNISTDSIVLAGICYLDTVITAVLIASGRCAEANPILQFYLQWGLGVMCCIKVASFTVPLAALEWYRRRKPGFGAGIVRATTLLYLVCYFTAAAVVNLRAAAG
jgi:hypothetical protein